MCVYACMYACMNVYMHVRISQVYMHACMHACSMWYLSKIYVMSLKWLWPWPYVCVCVYVCMYVCMSYAWMYSMWIHQWRHAHAWADVIQPFIWCSLLCGNFFQLCSCLVKKSVQNPGYPLPDPCVFCITRSHPENTGKACVPDPTRPEPLLSYPFPTWPDPSTALIYHPHVDTTFSHAFGVLFHVN